MMKGFFQFFRHGRELTLLLMASANFPIGAASALADPIPVTVKTVQEDSLQGDLVSLSTQTGAELRLDSGAVKSIPLRDLVRVTSGLAGPPPGRSDVTIMLKNGDFLLGRLSGSAGNEVSEQRDNIRLETTDIGTLTVPLDWIARLMTSRAGQPGYRDSVAWFHRGESTDGDRLLLTNGDVVRGFVEGVDANGVTVDLGSAESRIPMRHLVTVDFEKSGVPKSGHERMTFRIQLRTSGRITSSEMNWSETTATAKPWNAETVRIDAERIVGVDVHGGRWEWIVEREPVSAQNTPMLNLNWPIMPNRNVLGEPIRVAGQRYEHGIGVHSRTVLGYELAGGYQEFVTSFGMDDQSGPLADVSVEIRVDGHRQFEKSAVRPGELHGPIRIPVSGAKRLELIVDFGRNGDLQDRFNWVEPALIRD